MNNNIHILKLIKQIIILIKILKKKKMMNYNMFNILQMELIRKQIFHYFMMIIIIQKKKMINKITYFKKQLNLRSHNKVQTMSWKI